MSDPIHAYLEDLNTIRATGAAVKETSGYGTLANLFNACGSRLKPRVHCIIHLKNSGAGLPDGGLFTADQVKSGDPELPLLGQKPSRGAIEVKGPADQLGKIAGTRQVKEYVEHYGQVLLTNYREFLLLKRGADGAVVRLETFRLAETESDFWNLAAHPHRLRASSKERFEEYLKRVLLHAAPLNTPRDVAFFLASYARDARARIESVGDLPALGAVRGALEQALGMKFDAEKGEHFFRSTLVQTLFYGVFSAWVLWHKERPGRTDRFDWRTAAWTLRVPMIKALFEQVATPTKLGPLGLVEVLDWTAEALNRVDRAPFFEKFVESFAVQYFYEPFLEAFDPELRKELGVWYTPPEIVRYMVSRIDATLRTELEIADGLADPRVFVLDPCCGTGAYLVEVLRHIRETLVAKNGEDALLGEEMKQAAMKRVFGFEIMPAPFVVAHLQMGLLLQSMSAPFDEAQQERAGIFLTNALTGWDFAGENPQLKNWPELEAERAGAGKVKQEKPILVILGNPPYNAFAGISPEEEQGLVEPYKDGLTKVWGIKKFNLDDLYIRFFRLAERRIAEKTGRGVVCFISNFSYLGDPSYVVMRSRFMREFDSMWFDSLNGDSRETGKLTPDGRPDPSIFSTEYNREGIKLGTAIGLLVRREKRNSTPSVRCRQFWGGNKRAELLASLDVPAFDEQYGVASPTKDNRYSFLPLNVSQEYFAWPLVTDLCDEEPISGLQEMRHGAFLDIDRSALADRVRKYFDPSVAWDEVDALKGGFELKAGGFVPRKARDRALRDETFEDRKIRPYALYPFDTRWCYYGALKDEFEDLIGTKAPCITKRLSLVVSAQASLPPKLRNGRRTGLAVLRPFLSLPPPRRVRRGLRWPNPI